MQVCFKTFEAYCLLLTLPRKLRNIKRGNNLWGFVEIFSHFHIYQNSDFSASFLSVSEYI